MNFMKFHSLSQSNSPTGRLFQSIEFLRAPGWRSPSLLPSPSRERLAEIFISARTVVSQTDCLPFSLSQREAGVRKRRSVSCIVVLATAFLILASAFQGFAQAPTSPAPSKTIFKAGFAERDITPGIGMEQPGGYGKSFHRTFHDACKVRAVVFDDGKNRVALVGLDTLAVPRYTVLEARAEIAKRTGIKPESVMIGASHSHSSGPVGMVQPGEYDHASDLVKDLAYNKSSMADAGFMQLLKRQIVEAVVFADSTRAEAKLAVGYGHEDKVAYNRRLRMKGGLSFSHPGAGNPDIIGYAGPTDPQVGTVGVWDLKGNLLGVVVNFSCHATTSPGGASANWIWSMEKTLRGATGNAGLPVVFLQGACGDVTQVDNLTKVQNPGAEEWCERVGGRIGAEAFKTLLLIRQGAGSEIPVDARQKVWNIKRRAPTSEKLKNSLALVEQGPAKAGATEWTFAKEILMLDALIQKWPEVEVEVQAIQVGPAVFVSNPAEYFVQFGLDIKQGSKFPFTFPVELANGCVGYVPTEEAFGPNGGGYETRMSSYSNLEITAGRQFANTGIELANRMTPGKVPMPPPAPPYKAPWAYGAVPPELK
jgi:neutral ceramidase